MECCKKDVLNGVDKFHKCGIPGNMVIFGDDVEVLISGDKEEDVVVAAGVYGEGRVMAISHDTYAVNMFDEEGTYDNSTFYQNARKWLSKKDKDIKMLLLRKAPAFKELKDLKAFDIIISTGEERVEESIVDQYVKEGGGFLEAVTPWGWLQLNPSNSIVDIPYSKLLNKVGIAFWDGVIYSETLKIHRYVTNKALMNVKDLLKQEDRKDMINNASFVFKLVKLPLEQCLTFTPMIIQIWEEVSIKVKNLCTAERVCSNNRFEKITLDTFGSLVRLQPNKAFKAPGIKHFPGDYKKIPPRNCKTFTFKSCIEDIHVTSCHIPAGTLATLKVTALKGVWKVIVGAHTDCLTDDKCRRWPIISHKVVLDEVKDYQLSTAFGGSIYLLSPDETDAHIEVNFDDVVFCPCFDIRQPSTWTNSRQQPGIWADLSGKHVTFTFPSDSVRSLENPQPVLELFDRLLEGYHDLKGTDIGSARRMWVVSDEQPVAGYMHAGYPIVTHLDVTQPNKEAFLLSTQNFQAGRFWGMFHEMGHNMQDAAWTFEGTVEVTVNIFSLYGMQLLCQQPILANPWLVDQRSRTSRYLKDGADFKEWMANPGVALNVYAQLAHHFGWEAYKKVFRHYNALPEEQKPTTQQDSIDMWFITFSTIVKRNLHPWAHFWGIPLSESAIKAMAAPKMQYHIPEDCISQLDSARLQSVKRDF